MPGYPWLEKDAIDPGLLQRKMRVLHMLGTPYSEADISAAPSAVQGKTEMDALIAYLQSLGLARPRGSGEAP